MPHLPPSCTHLTYSDFNLPTSYSSSLTTLDPTFESSASYFANNSSSDLQSGTTPRIVDQNFEFRRLSASACVVSKGRSNCTTVTSNNSASNSNLLFFCGEASRVIASSLSLHCTTSRFCIQSGWTHSSNLGSRSVKTRRGPILRLQSSDQLLSPGYITLFSDDTFWNPLHNWKSKVDVLSEKPLLLTKKQQSLIVCDFQT
jgi:hypothetical protein